MNGIRDAIPGDDFDAGQADQQISKFYGTVLSVVFSAYEKVYTTSSNTEADKIFAYIIRS